MWENHTRSCATWRFSNLRTTWCSNYFSGRRWAMSSHNHPSSLTVDLWSCWISLVRTIAFQRDDSSEGDPYDTENLSDDSDTDSDEPVPALQTRGRGRGRVRGGGANHEEAGDVVMAGDVVVEGEMWMVMWVMRMMKIMHSQLGKIPMLHPIMILNFRLTWYQGHTSQGILSQAMSWISSAFFFFSDGMIEKITQFTNDYALTTFHWRPMNGSFPHWDRSTLLAPISINFFY